VDGAPVEASGVIPVPPRGDKIYIEFVVTGDVVKATAIDSATGIEASVMGPARASRAALEAAAVRKLVYLMKKRGGAN